MMKRAISLILLIILLVHTLSSCEAERDAYEIVRDFVSAYGAEGVIYSPRFTEGEEGYIRDDLVRKIYVFSGRFPENYAVFLNSRLDFSSECGAFVSSDAEMLGMIEEMCLERIRLLSEGGSHAFVKRSRNLVFYSTMKDRARAEKIFSEIIR